MKRGLLIVAVLSLSFAHAQQIRSGEDLLRAMHERYKDTWYRTLTFTQKSTTYKPDGTSSAETWYEAASFRGNCGSTLGRHQRKGIRLRGRRRHYRQREQSYGEKAFGEHVCWFSGLTCMVRSPRLRPRLRKRKATTYPKIREDTWKESRPMLWAPKG